MRITLRYIVLLIVISISSTLAQEPKDYFPHNVGNRWDYNELYGGTPYFYSETITDDSLLSDGGRYIYINGWANPSYLVDTSNNVFTSPHDSLNKYLRYKLDADTGDAWENPNAASVRWAWVARIESAYVFSIPTVIKEFRYGPGRPASANSPGLVERWLAEGFGLIYSWQEPNDISSLIGCVIDGDTSGYVTAVETTELDVPSDFTLHQNYPNPFNPSTIIEFNLPNDAEINLAVYDMLGRKAVILYEGFMKSGDHKVHWNAEGFASGLYICRLHAGRFTRAIKMLLAK